MQRLLSIILVLSFFSYQSYHSLIYLNYLANKSYFANVLCENKDNPKKPGCNGKCHLKKQLEKKKPVEDHHPFSKSASIIFYPELIAVLQGQLDLLNQQIAQKKNFNFYTEIILSPHIRSVFHPPKS